MELFFAAIVTVVVLIAIVISSIRSSPQRSCPITVTFSFPSTVLPHLIQVVDWIRITQPRSRVRMMCERRRMVVAVVDRGLEITTHFSLAGLGDCSGPVVAEKLIDVEQLWNGLKSMTGKGPTIRLVFDSFDTESLFNRRRGKGSLCLASMCWDDNVGEYVIDIWLMKQNDDVPEWSKLITIPCADPTQGIPRPICFVRKNDDQVLLANNFARGKLFLWNPKDESVEIVTLAGVDIPSSYDKLHVIPFTGSLVSP